MANRVGEWRKHGLIAGEGDHPPCTSEARKGGDTPAITKRSRAAAETAWPLRQGAGTGPKNTTNDAAARPPHLGLKDSTDAVARPGRVMSIAAVKGDARRRPEPHRQQRRQNLASEIRRPFMDGGRAG